jgi:hypothetical protein
MALRSHFSGLALQNCDLGDFEKAIFHVVDMTFQLIFYLLAVPKCDLGDVRTHLLPSERNKMRLGRGREGDASRGRLVLRTHFLPSVPPKMKLVRCRESDVSMGRMALRTYFVIQEVQKCDFGEFQKVLFLMFYRSSELISAFWLAQNPTWTVMRK